MKITEHNAITGETIEREMTSTELAQRDKDQLEYATIDADKRAKAEERTALLAKLGITQEEADLLLFGVN